MQCQLCATPRVQPSELFVSGACTSSMKQSLSRMGLFLPNLVTARWSEVDQVSSKSIVSCAVVHVSSF